MTASRKFENFTATAGIPSLTKPQFAALARILLLSSGITLLENKHSLVTSRLGKRLRTLGLTSWDQYIELLQRQNSPELIHFVNGLTTNKTSFFREEKHFDYLSEIWLPQRMSSGDPVYSWIAASSRGHEAYTLGMVLTEAAAKKHKDISWKILATDIDTEALSEAIAGVYPADQVKDDVSHSLIQKYFLRGTGPNSGKFKISPALAANIKFRQHNLCAFDQSVPLKFDIIFLRNVLIYFNRSTVEKVITKCVKHLKPGGMLFLGHCESILEMKWDLKTIGPSIYQRPHEQ